MDTRYIGQAKRCVTKESTYSTTTGNKYGKYLKNLFWKKLKITPPASTPPHPTNFHHSVEYTSGAYHSVIICLNSVPVCSKTLFVYNSTPYGLASVISPLSTKAKIKNR